ncbi:MAG: transcription termination/antitermination protein NusA [Deltaproteobacteria bacterium]|nr:transcription termination/antitermination protein NusA [Deltaproteobacteria bacterium]
MILDIGQIITQLGKEKGIDKGVIVDAIKEALEIAARKKYGMNKKLEATYDAETGEFEILEFRTVVESVTDPEAEITLAAAQEYDPEAVIDDNIGFRMSTRDLGRIAAQTARQIIMQKVKDAEREVIYGEFIGRKGEIINGIVQRYERDCLVIDLGKTEAIMPLSEQIPRERYRQGDRIRAYIKDVSKTPRGPEILLSRSDPRVILKLFEQEVPEVYEGVVSILSVAREPGFRTKIAVKSKDRDVDPVGACVGMKGSRVQSVVQELRGERIDIIAWDEDPAKFVCNALQPAEIIRVLVNESEKNMEVIVPEEQLLLAIGKKGQNVKLASKLVGWHIEVRAEGQVEDALKRAEGLFAPKKAPEDAVQAAPQTEAGTAPDSGEGAGETPPAEGGPAEAPVAEEATAEVPQPPEGPEAATSPTGEPPAGEPGGDAS